MRVRLGFAMNSRSPSGRECARNVAKIVFWTIRAQPSQESCAFNVRNANQIAFRSERARPSAEIVRIECAEQS